MTSIKIRDVSLYVKVVGQGYPLLLLHGGPGLDHTSLLPLQGCADQFTLVFYDHRCNGRSIGVPVETMTWDNLVADAEALREMLGFNRWAVLGHSFGGNVALEYALRCPDRISHLMLMDTCGDERWAQQHAPDLLARRGYRPDAVEAARRFFNGQVTPDQWMSTALKFADAYYDHLGFLGRMLEMVKESGVKMRPEAHIFGFGQLLAGWSVMDRLSEINVPTLVLAGRHDFLFPPECQAILADRLPNAQLELIERAGHNAPSEQPAVVIAAIRRFLAGDAPAPENSFLPLYTEVHQS